MRTAYACLLPHAINPASKTEKLINKTVTTVLFCLTNCSTVAGGVVPPIPAWVGLANEVGV
jgi:hypothetical protein